MRCVKDPCRARNLLFNYPHSSTSMSTLSWTAWYATRHSVARDHALTIRHSQSPQSAISIPSDVTRRAPHDIPQSAADFSDDDHNVSAAYNSWANQLNDETGAASRIPPKQACRSPLNLGLCLPRRRPTHCYHTSLRPHRCILGVLLELDASPVRRFSLCLPSTAYSRLRGISSHRLECLRG